MLVELIKKFMEHGTKLYFVNDFSTIVNTFQSLTKRHIFSFCEVNVCPVLLALYPTEFLIQLCRDKFHNQRLLIYFL